MKKINYEEFIENNTIRVDASGRGGGIEIDVAELFGEDCKMTAYQNYLGGGMLGSIQSDCNFNAVGLTASKQKIFGEIDDALKRYFHNLTNHSEDEWEDQSFEKNQSMPVSAY